MVLSGGGGDGVEWWWWLSSGVDGVGCGHGRGSTGHEYPSNYWLWRSWSSYTLTHC